MFGSLERIPSTPLQPCVFMYYPSDQSQPCLQPFVLLLVLIPLPPVTLIFLGLFALSLALSPQDDP